ncbi:hypothetical protein LWI28_002451 [Acer negundo]|uniref:Uncharacterized protein n=1 Tax=Acer negundo TaxID=4023 RepID=A0AAD5NPM1_ACENE|nr:hypothetical protein LWI28_002451 [Acer negundo]
MGYCNQGTAKLRKDNSFYNTTKGKDTLVLSRKSKSRQQYQGVGFGSIILEKRNFGEKESESLEFDSLSSSDQGTLRAEKEISGILEGGEEEEINASQPTNMGMDEFHAINKRDRGRPRLSVVKTHGIRTRLTRSKEPEQNNPEEPSIDIVDTAGKHLSWCLEEEITSDRNGGGNRSYQEKTNMKEE